MFRLGFIAFAMIVLVLRQENVLNCEFFLTLVEGFERSLSGAITYLFYPSTTDIMLNSCFWDTLYILLFGNVAARMSM